MHRIPSAAFALVLLLAPAAAGQEDDGAGDGDGEVVEVRLTMNSGEGGHWFECTGPVCDEGRDPALTLEPGRTYRFRVTNQGQVQHDLHLGGGLDADTNLLKPGEETELTFTVPEDAEGEAEYWCSPHRSLGMGGDIVFEAASVGGGSDDNDSPGPGAGTAVLAVAVAAAMLLLDRARR